MNSTETTTPSGLNSRTKQILITIGSIGAIIIGALLVYGILVTPARQPYRDALAQYRNVGNANAMLTAAGASLNAGKATDAEFEKSIKTAQATLASLKTENEALGKEAVLKDGEGKQKYDAFNEKLQVYMAYNESILASMLKVRPVLYDCNQKMTTITESNESIAAIKACSAKLAALEGVTDADYKTLVASFQDDYTNLATIIEKIVSLKDPKGADATQYQTLTNARTEALTQLSDTSTQFAKSVQQHRSEVLTTNTADILKKYLNDKSRIF